jgi:vitamin B12 transporter
MSHILMPSALALAIFAVSNAQAADSTQANNSQQLPLIVVTASKTPEAIEKVPARISVIDEKTIQQSPAADLPSLLQQEAALNVVKLGGYGQQASIFIRGTNSNHTLVLHDGMRTNTATLSAANINLFDVTGVSQIEVLKGPASVQYGSDAIGGVVQLISEPPKKQRLFTTLEGGEQNTYKAIVGADLVQDDAYFQIRGQRLETDGSPVSDTPNAKDASYDQKGYSLKGGIENEQYAVSAQFQENKGNSEYNPLLTGNQDYLNRLLNLKGSYALNTALKINARYSEFTDELDQTTSTDFAHTKSKEADINIKWDFIKNQNILFGVTRRNTEADYQTISSWGNTIYDKTIKTTGYYLQHQYQQDALSTQAGIRVEDNKTYGSHTVGQLAARLQVAPLTSVYANIGTAFHAPDASQLYGGSSSNPDLTPEESVSYELGLDQTIGYGLSAYTSIYQTKVKDLIGYNSSFKLENIQKAQLTGGELGLKWKHNAWFTNLEYAYVQPKNETTNKELTRRPRQTATLSTGWDNGVFGASVSLVSKSQAKDYSANDPTPGFVTANVNGFYQVTPYARLFANIQNIGDNSYKTALYNNFPSAQYYVAAPRLTTAGITLSY